MRNISNLFHICFYKKYFTFTDRSSRVVFSVIGYFQSSHKLLMKFWKKKCWSYVMSTIFGGCMIKRNRQDHH